jgi:maleate cis-trans isomerase
MDRIADLETSFQRPIITANQATVWHALDLARSGIQLPADGILWSRSKQDGHS